MKEIWRNVFGYEGLYEVSNRGRVRSVYTRCGTYRGRILKKRFLVNGYFGIDLCVNGYVKRIGTHRLVLETFVSPRPRRMQCRHLNDIKTDNRIENLKWGTRKENWADARRNKIPMGMEGKRHSKESRKEMCGKKCSKETRRKISIALTGREFSRETRKKLAVAQLGKKYSKEARKRMSIARLRYLKEKENQNGKNPSSNVECR